MSKTSSNSQTIGELIGTVSGLTKAFESMQRTQSDNRQEFMEVFKGIRADNAQFLDALNQHIAEEADIHQKVINIEPKVNTLWDLKNSQHGAFTAGKAILVGGGGFLMAVGSVALDRLWGR